MQQSLERMIDLGIIKPEQKEEAMDQLNCSAQDGGGSDESIDTQDAKQILMDKQFVNKLGIHWLKQNHKEEIERFYKILQEGISPFF